VPLAVGLELQARTRRRDGPADPCMDHPLSRWSAPVNINVSVCFSYSAATGYKPSQTCVECIYRAARCGRSATFSVQIMMAMSDIQVRGTHGAPGVPAPDVRVGTGTASSAGRLQSLAAVQFPYMSNGPRTMGRFRLNLRALCHAGPTSDAESDSAASSSHTGVPVAHTADHTSIWLYDGFILVTS
jgi:hypothetical protein